MFNGKKGLESSIIVAIIIIISGVILLFAVKAIANIGNDAVDREACRTSVLLKEKSKLLGTNPLITDLNCETNLVDVNSKDEVEIKKIIVNEMYDCWYQFGEGKRDFLDNYDFGRGDNYCFVCSRIDFSEKTQNEVPQITNLMSYLSNEQLPLHTQETFFDYLYGKDSYVKPTEDESIFSTKTPLYIVFFADKRLDAWDNVQQEGKVAIAATILGAIGGCIAGGIGGTLALPIIGTTVGCVAGAKLGIGVGLVIAGGNSVIDIASRRTGYYPALYVGNDEKIVEWCKQ